MSSLDQQQNSATEQYSNTDAFRLSSSDAEQMPVEQLPFPEYPIIAGNPLTPPLSSSTTDSSTALAPRMQSLNAVPLVTRELPDVKTDGFSTDSLKLNTTKLSTTTLRQPVLIRGTGKKSASLRPPESRRHPAKHAIVTVVLALVVLGALFTVVPLGNNGQSSLLKSIISVPNGQMNITNTKGDSFAAIAQQAATATMVTQDGFDPGPAVYAGVPTAPPGMNAGSTGSAGSIGSTGSAGSDPVVGGTGFNRFFYGQCTYWANMRYYELTGHEVQWIGNANEWYAGALNAGWVVSSTPHVPSIIVLQAGVEGAGGYGHVAVVESISGPGVVHASNMNWYANGGFGIESYWDFNYPAAGVSFVWHP